jgi:hypothetical protein
MCRIKNGIAKKERIFLVGDVSTVCLQKLGPLGALLMRAAAVSTAQLAFRFAA